jgi:CBS domain containing-hemolysin-like protein
MSGQGLSWMLTLLTVLSVIFFILETLFAVALAATSGLSRIALRRMSAESDGSLGFVEQMREPASGHRIAADLGRQLCLLAVVFCLVSAAQLRGSEQPLLWGVGLAAAIGALLLESVLGRLIAIWDPRRALRLTAGLLRAAHTLLAPVVYPVRIWLARVESRNDGEEPTEEEQEEDVEALIEVGEREGLLEGNEGEMMRSIVDLDETHVREIMTPRPDIVALPVDAEMAQARQLFLDTGHRRIPVYRQNIDEVAGLLHVRDLLRALDGAKASESIEPLIRDAMFVPESLTVAELLGEMRLKTHMALVVDEYGGTAGLVTLEDLLEEIVGEIRDEHETGGPDVQPQDDGSWIISAGVHVETLQDLFEIEFGERDYDTVGGLVVSELGRLPRCGESVNFGPIRLEVLEVERRRIRQVRVVMLPQTDEAQVAP